MGKLGDYLGPWCRREHSPPAEWEYVFLHAWAGFYVLDDRSVLYPPRLGNDFFLCTRHDVAIVWVPAELAQTIWREWARPRGPWWERKAP